MREIWDQNSKNNSEGKLRSTSVVDSKRASPRAWHGKLQEKNCHKKGCSTDCE